MSFFSFRNSAERRFEDLLMAHADALISGTVDIDGLLRQYHWVTRRQVDSLLILAERLNKAFVVVKPSDDFVKELRRQLDEANTFENRSLWRQFRDLSPRTQLAAGIGGATLTAGVVYFASRPVRDALEDLWHRATA